MRLWLSVVMVALSTLGSGCIEPSRQAGVKPKTDDERLAEQYRNKPDVDGQVYCPNGCVVTFPPTDSQIAMTEEFAAIPPPDVEEKITDQYSEKALKSEWERIRSAIENKPGESGGCSAGQTACRAAKGDALACCDSNQNCNVDGVNAWCGPKSPSACPSGTAFCGASGISDTTCCRTDGSEECKTSKTYNVAYCDQTVACSNPKVTCGKKCCDPAANEACVSARLGMVGACSKTACKPREASCRGKFQGKDITICCAEGESCNSSTTGFPSCVKPAPTPAPSESVTPSPTPSESVTPDSGDSSTTTWEPEPQSSESPIE